MASSKTSERVVAAYGGAEIWKNSRTVEITFSAHGLLFWMKGQPTFRQAQGRFEVAQPQGRIQPIDRAGNVGVLSGQDVHIEDNNGNTIATRQSARDCFRGRKLLWWDRLDFTYFACYAMWNYLTLPALLLREDIRWVEVAPNVLDAHFPKHLPTHSERQRFYFDTDSGLLRRQDYTVAVVGDWAKASMVILEHSVWNGIPYVSLRRGMPRKAGGEPRKWPVMVEIRFHEWRLR